MPHHPPPDDMSNESSVYVFDYEDYEDYDEDYDFGNGTRRCQFGGFTHARWILPTLYSFFFLVGLLGNVVVITVVSKRSSRRADTFILHLAVSDLLFILTLPLWASSTAHGGCWHFGAHLCKGSVFVIAVTRCASSLLMAVMSVDRYLAVIKGKKMHPLRTRSCSIGACCTIWAISVLLGCPSLVSRHLNGNSACVDDVESSLNLGFKVVVVFLTFVLPFTVVLFCYCSMAKYLWHYFGKQVRATASIGKPRREHRWLRIVSCVVGAFCFSWLPYNTLSLVVVISHLRKDMTFSTDVIVNQAVSATAALAFANSCANPLIYALLDAGFRRRAQLSLPEMILKCRSVLPIPGWSVATTSVSMDSTSTYTGK